jgi:hypothetical protein
MYNASAVKVYNTTNRLDYFFKKNISFLLKERSSLLPTMPVHVPL